MLLARLAAKRQGGGSSQAPPPNGDSNGAYAQQDPRYAANDPRVQNQWNQHQGQQYAPQQYDPMRDQYQHHNQQQQGPPQFYGAPQQQYAPQQYQQQQYSHQQYSHQQYPQQPYNQAQNPPQPDHSQPPPPPWSPQHDYTQPPQYHNQQAPPSASAEEPCGPSLGYQLEKADTPDAMSPLSPRGTSSAPRPCVIPQISKKFGGENLSPFVRIRVPELESQISHHELIVFIDQLNEAFMANPALQMANSAANVAGFVPNASVQLISLGVNVVAGVGSVAVSKVRMKNCLAKFNEELFQPKGLHVQVCKTDKMLGYVGLDGQKDVFTRQRYQDALETAQMQTFAPSEPTGTNPHPIMERMQSLGDRVMGLSFDDVEAANEPEGWMKKWGAKEAGKAEQKQFEKMQKEQAKEDRKAAKREEKRAERAEKGKEVDPKKQMKEDKKLEKKAEKAAEKKGKKVKKILWIVITAKEQAAGADDDWDSGSEA